MGGFTFRFWYYLDKSGQMRAHPYRIGISIKHMDSKRAIKGFTGGIEPDEEDQIPEGSTSGKPKEATSFAGISWTRERSPSR